MDEKNELAKEKQNELSNIAHVVAVMSGKGGVGKSSVTALLATSLARKGYKVGVLDADITGPSIPKLFGIHSRAESFEFGILPAKTKLGIEVMSLNLLLEHEDDPVIWRGPLIAGAVKQFWTDVVWGDLDYMLLDLPPGTGDAPLTVMQSLPLDGLLIVSSPQELAIMVVKKAINMASMMKVPVLGLIENMSYVICPKCSEILRIFGPSKGEEVAKAAGIPFLGALPIDVNLVELCDKGKIEKYNSSLIDNIVDRVVTFDLAPTQTEKEE
ncbi:MAG TPA: Mrp/NBP35 family ATP-binding protein [Firmicutes bacterium]|nr:Mrp/NBP35 family ATP-binding protein [Bacillota bacterium]